MRSLFMVALLLCASLSGCLGEDLLLTEDCSEFEATLREDDGVLRVLTYDIASLSEEFLQDGEVGVRSAVKRLVLRLCEEPLYRVKLPSGGGGVERRRAADVEKPRVLQAEDGGLVQGGDAAERRLGHLLHRLLQ